MNDYDVRFAGGFVRYASASSRQAAAELALSEQALPHPPADDPSRRAACYVKEHGGSIAETPFWRATEADEPDAIPVEDLNASNDK